MRVCFCVCVHSTSTRIKIASRMNTFYFYIKFFRTFKAITQRHQFSFFFVITKKKLQQQFYILLLLHLQFIILGIWIGFYLSKSIETLLFMQIEWKDIHIYMTTATATIPSPSSFHRNVACMNNFCHCLRKL